MYSSWKPGFSHEDVDFDSEETLYSGFFKIKEKRLRFKLFAGGWSPPIKRFQIERRDAASIILYNPRRDTVVMVEQVRVAAFGHSAGPWLLEPVAGLIETGDSPEETARREAMEEANCEVKDIVPITRYLVSPGISTEYCWLYCGKIESCQDGSICGLQEESEDIKVHEIPRPELFGLVTSGAVFAATAVIAVHWLELNYKDLQLKWVN